MPLLSPILIRLYSSFCKSVLFCGIDLLFLISTKCTLWNCMNQGLTKFSNLIFILLVSKRCQHFSDKNVHLAVAKLSLTLRSSIPCGRSYEIFQSAICFFLLTAGSVLTHTVLRSNHFPGIRHWTFVFFVLISSSSGVLSRSQTLFQQIGSSLGVRLYEPVLEMLGMRQFDLFTVTECDECKVLTSKRSVYPQCKEIENWFDRKSKCCKNPLNEHLFRGYLLKIIFSRVIWFFILISY